MTEPSEGQQPPAGPPGVPVAWRSAATGLRDALASQTTHPVTFGWGPRFLHSTGQYHKGGPSNGTFLQITGAVWLTHLLDAARAGVTGPGR
jgi:hypothetical protein